MAGNLYDKVEDVQEYTKALFNSSYECRICHQVFYIPSESKMRLGFLRYLFKNGILRKQTFEKLKHGILRKQTLERLERHILKEHKQMEANVPTYESPIPAIVSIDSKKEILMLEENDSDLYYELRKEKETSTCNILKKHAELLKDDPQRLSTEFIQKLIGSKCSEVD